MTVPTSVRIKRLREQLDKMTQIADTFNLQLQLLYTHLGAEQFNKIVGTIPVTKKQVIAAQEAKFNRDVTSQVSTIQGDNTHEG